MENSSPTTKLKTETISEISGQTKSDLPEEIVIDILSRLRVKPVFQLQCLSKKFLSITYDRSFIHAHLKQSTHLRPSIIINQSNFIKNQQFNFSMIQYNGLDSEITVENLPTPCNMIWPHLRSSYIKIVGSCNGLVILIVDKEFCFVWNPATMQCDGLPLPSIVPYQYISMTSWGFSYCAESRVYKIVRVLRVIPNIRSLVCLVDVDFSLHSKSLAEVFTYGKDCAWRNIDFSKFDDKMACDGDGVTVKGVVYWIIWFGENNVYKLLTFDLEREKFARIFSPPSVDGKIMEFRGSLALCAQSAINENSFDLWVLKDGDECDILNNIYWEKIYTIDEIFPRKPIRCLNDHQLLLINRDEGLYDYSCSLYDLVSKETREIPEALASSVDEVYNFVESIVPISAQGEGSLI